MEEGRSPAFQFYPKDWLTDSRVVSMTALQRGIYIQLLCYCWLEGWLPIDPKKLSLLSGAQGMTEQEFLEHWDAIEPCFEVATDGKGFIHPRLDKERLKQEQWREKCSKGGKVSASIRQQTGNTAVPSLQSSSPKDIKPLSSDSKESKPDKFSEWDLGMAEAMRVDILQIDPKYKFKSTIESWANDIRLMRERDKRTEEEIGMVWLWANANSFWRSNILSPGKLREKFTQLVLKMNRDKPDLKVLHQSLSREELLAKIGEQMVQVKKHVDDGKKIDFVYLHLNLGQFLEEYEVRFQMEPVNEQGRRWFNDLKASIQEKEAQAEQNQEATPSHNDLVAIIKLQMALVEGMLTDEKRDGVPLDHGWLDRVAGHLILEYSERFPKGPHIAKYTAWLDQQSEKVMNLIPEDAEQ